MYDIDLVEMDGYSVANIRNKVVGCLQKVGADC